MTKIIVKTTEKHIYLGRQGYIMNTNDDTIILLEPYAWNFFEQKWTKLPFFAKVIPKRKIVAMKGYIGGSDA